ncbi:hypothetical protein Sjap_025403 [Stephania japonica]|uniref:non-specific serine/threonine protein kinase n=1 Tax=Stephania japonica TaxID=461633 RepID=A0AAP0E625_9MAGN
MASFIATLLLFILFVDRLCSASDSITHKKFLREGEKLVSNDGIYALGFFNPGNSQKRYVGIWYNEIQEQTVLWVANRNNPIHNSSRGIVKMVERGNLAVFNGNASNPVWSTNISIPISKKINSSSLFYKLLDTGNLVLYDEKRGDFLWQSFDYPTDTILPGMKIGFSLRSGVTWSLTSWKSPDDPSTGEFTVGIDHTGSTEVFIKRASQKIWRSGPWTGEGWNGVPGMGPSPVINVSLVNNEPDEIYYLYSNASVWTRLVLDYMGIARRATWAVSTHTWVLVRSYPDDICDNYGKCGVFGSCHPNNNQSCVCISGYEPKSAMAYIVGDGSKGCVRKRELLCGKGDGFLKMENMKLPETSKLDAYLNGSGCLAWFGDLIDMRGLPEWGQDLFVRVDAVELNQTRSISLDWKMRYDIILGIARGVLYLHQDSRLRIIHRDLKASNILLDAKMNPKISDFGMARIFGGDQSQANTRRVVGTYGYMSPEYAMDGLFSIKSDVFSFGAWELWEDDRILELVDSSMENSFPEQEVVRFIQVGILCVQENAKDRPTMSDVIFILFVVPLCFANDTITHNESLTEEETLVSNGGTYALGFFSPGNSKQRYVGIWYNKIPERNIVWVGNRNNPLNSSSGVAKIDESGNLAVFHGNASSPVWSTNLSFPLSDGIDSSTIFCKLLDTGNLVLRDENRGDILWQSFDYPTDTLLPGMKLGFNSKSGVSWSLSSWKSPDDPSTGDFTLSMSRTGSPEVIIKNKSQDIWRTGPWTAYGWNGVPGMLHNTVINSSLMNNQDEIYYMHNLYNTSVFLKVVLNYLGFDQTSIWVESTGRWLVIRSYPDDTCDHYGECGVFGSCHPNNARFCSCLPGFEPKSPEDWITVDTSKGCVRKRELLCGKGDGFLRLEKMKLPDTSNARVDMSLGIEECEMECRNNCSCNGYSSADGNGSGCLSWFGDLTDIKEFTDWGQDLFVRVDAIELENSMKHSKGSSSFTKKKLVLLCVLIVGGLLIFIFALCCFFKKAKRRDQTRSILLDWKMCCEIILGIARGVLYLHQDSRLRIIHRDLKASNILLDAKMNPKISDFGMARIFGGDQSEGNTGRVVGTYGYMSPEYAMDGLFSIKSDVFSFGVLLLEIISGKKNSGFYREDSTKNLMKHAWELWIDGRILELVDSSMDNSFPEQEIVRFIQVGILCVQENAKDRPTMSDVIFMLRNETPIPSLKQPAFVLTSKDYSAKASTTGSTPSLNDMSITIVEGR